jgi:hypothetical protein
MKMAIFFPDFRFGTRKVWGNFRHRKVGFPKIRNFAEIGCIFATYRKTKPRKKKTFSGELGFPILDDFSEISDLYRFYPNFIMCTCCAERVLWKTPKMHKLFRNFRIWKRENFPGNFRAVFFSDGFPFFRISEFREIGPNFFEIYIVTLLKWHITLRF